MYRFKPHVRADSARSDGHIVAHMKFTLNDPKVPDAGLCLIVRVLLPGDSPATALSDVQNNLAADVKKLLSQYADSAQVFDVPPTTVLEGV